MTYKTLAPSRPRKRAVRPQSAMLTLYGDYLLNRRDKIGIGSLITLLGNFGISKPAVRSAVSRMCRAGLLKGKSKGRKNYYALTPKGHKLLTEGAQRIFERKEARWNGTWSIVNYSVPERQRKKRDALRRELAWMGYGAAGAGTMISPYDLSAEVIELAQRLGATDNIHVFEAREKGSGDARKVVASCWDLGRISKMYASFIAKYQPRFLAWSERLERGESVEAGEYFVERFALIHEYRKLPFYDPDLPDELLPDDWLRPKAALLFQEFHDLLDEKATEYFNTVLDAY